MRHLISGFLRIFGLGIHRHIDAIRLRVADKDADAKVIVSDWQAVGDDLRWAMGIEDERK